MTSPILVDARTSPRLFLWNGPIGMRRIAEWTMRHGWLVPSDLVELWAATGGGEVFESERFLRPLVSAEGTDEVAEVTQWWRTRGMADGLVVFHEGLGFTAIRCADGAYISHDNDAAVIGVYTNLDRWYSDVLRAEYAARYGLPPPVG